MGAGGVEGVVAESGENLFEDVVNGLGLVEQRHWTSVMWLGAGVVVIAVALPLERRRSTADAVGFVVVTGVEFGRVWHQVVFLSLPLAVTPGHGH